MYPIDNLDLHLNGWRLLHQCHSTSCLHPVYPNLECTAGNHLLNGSMNVPDLVFHCKFTRKEIDNVLFIILVSPYRISYIGVSHCTLIAISVD